MTDESLLDDLLDDWEQAQTQGAEITPEDLCVDHPELIEPLKKRIAQLQSIDDRLQATPELEATQPVRQWQPSSRIGRYKLLQKLGEGGMGEVWMAEQLEPVSRRVALKIIKAGREASKEVIARFEAERQALALMDHPNIARVFDGGTTEDGQPFFVMELVQGIPITEFCDQQQLTPEERLQLFLPVCQAVQHAHQKAIIHRDLKPSNVLVALYDGIPVPKVIDFGLAKAVDMRHKLTDKTVFTEFGQVLGTVLYMSPEQAEMNQLDVDTRTDIYSLGVLLYELLTGTTPIERSTLQERMVLQVLKLLQESDPPRPSRRLSSSQEQAAGISYQRKTEVQRLIRMLESDLDWIVMKALEKDRSRRYETASAFAEDVERYLEGGVVEARPPSAAYRVRKLISKHRGWVAAVFAVAAALIVGIVGITWFALRAADEKDRAKQEAAKANVAAKRANDVLQIVTAAFQATDPNTGSDFDMSARQVLDHAYATLGESTLDDRGRAQLLATLTTSYLGQHAYKEASSVGREAFEVRKRLFGPEHPDTLGSMADWAMSLARENRFSEALPLYEQTYRQMEQHLGPTHESTLITKANMAAAYNESGTVDTALPLLESSVKDLEEHLGQDHEQTLIAMNNLTNIYALVDQPQRALRLSKRVVNAMRAKLGPRHPKTLAAEVNLAGIESFLGKSTKAQTQADETISKLSEKLGDDDPRTINALRVKAGALRDEGKLVEAVGLYEEALERAEATLGAEHLETLTIKNNLALTLQQKGDLDRAIALYEETLGVFKAGYPAQHFGAISTKGNLAGAYWWAGQVEKAVPLFEQTLEYTKEQFGPDHAWTVRSMKNLAFAYRANDEHEKALLLLEETLEAMKGVSGAESEDALQVMTGLGATLLKLGQYEKARDVLTKRLELSDESRSAPWRIANTKSLLGDAFLRLGDLSQAETLLESSYEGLSTAADSIPSMRKKEILRAAVNRLINLADAKGDPSAAEKWRAKLADD